MTTLNERILANNVRELQEQLNRSYQRIESLRKVEDAVKKYLNATTSSELYKTKKEVKFLEDLIRTLETGGQF